MSHEAVSVYRTTNGGATWALASGSGRFTANMAPPPGSLPLAGDKSGIAFADKTDGWVSGSEPMPGNVYLYRTTDGGSTWQPQRIPKPRGHGIALAMFSVSPPHFFSAATGVLAVSGIPAHGAGATFIYTTSDGGARWKPARTLPLANATLSFATPALGWALNNTLTGATLEATANGGATWTRLSLPVGFAGASLQRVTPQLGFLWEGAGGRVWRSVDGGHTWAAFAMSLEPG